MFSPKKLTPAEIKAKRDQDEKNLKQILDFYRVHESEKPEEQPTEVDSRDVDTPDNWVKREPKLVRLTGRHPFNVEAPLPELAKYGFITPVRLHYVRNHGLAPKCTWEDHKIRVSGLVEKELVLSMDDILNNYPVVSFPCTLVCAGNRRREENLRKNGIGFNWGAAGVSTTVWTGVRVRDILKHAGVLSEAQHVCYVGVEDLPGGGGCKYGTSTTLLKSMSPTDDVILAFKQNGKLLEPDHGYPIRLLIPGFIGGRMIKWLDTIEVTKEQSDNHYHYMDNRVLPSHVDAELAKKEGWWYKPEYIINDLNINSAIWAPAHDEVISATRSSYTVQGYAYTGGGRYINRMEITLDDGETWRLCEIKRTEQPTPYLKSWCWVQWCIDVPTVDLFEAKELCCRAWDCDMNTQAEHLTWNVMGMMNNSWFRIKLKCLRTNDGGLVVHSEHPTLPANQNGGWMVRQAGLTAPAPAPPAPAAVTKSGKTFTMADVEKHAADNWIVVNKKVYDCTPFLDDHPGGAESITMNAGTDTTEEFESLHSAKATQMLEDYYIGDLVEAKASAVVAPAVAEKAEETLTALGKGGWKQFPLIDVKFLSHDAAAFTFGLPTPEHRLGLPVGKHIIIRARIDGDHVLRSYTPSSGDDMKGQFVLVVKIYRKNTHPAFPNGGKMSQHLETLKVGDLVDFMGPTGQFTYEGKGIMKLGVKNKLSIKHFGMVAGGTGLTPMFQVINAILSDPEDKTTMSFIYCSKSESDILLREELETFAKEHPKRFKLWLVVDKASDPATWKQGTGFVTEEMLKEHLHLPKPVNGVLPESMVLMCGPPVMIEKAILPNLKKLGVDESSTHAF
nr:nitrate reductase-like protein [Rapaza viridis]BDU67343.1 nitrate reductase-like [Rapaza viridis]